MLSLTNENITLYCNEDGKGLTLIDRIHGEVWLLDENTLVCGDTDVHYGMKTEFQYLSIVKAEKEGDCLFLYISINDISFSLRFSLGEDYLDVTLPEMKDKNIGAVSLPGSFRPANSSAKYILPIMQGMWWDGRGDVKEYRHGEAGHHGFTMPMFGVFGKSGALLTVADTADDCFWWVGKDENGRTWASNIQVDSLGSMRYERKVRIYPVASNITKLAKRYRTRVKELNRFVTWEEKLAERPSLKRLFGSIMCFIGYCQDDLDYAAESKKLREYGFDKALLYPLRFNTYSRDFLMGGFAPIHLDADCVGKIKNLGFDVAPWSWINEGLDDSTAEMKMRFRHNRDGKPASTWQIDEQRWYACCTTQMEDFLRRQNENGFHDMTWDHFDVITCATNKECHALDHPAHPGKPLSKSEDREWIRKLLLAGRDGQKIVSSENFNDAYSLEYDLGSVKAWPQFGLWAYWPIPLTGLVYHDSMMHTWWEPHNYNMRFFNRSMPGLYEYGGGKARLMASMDALYGCPPDVFPFGAMYGWQGDGSKTFLYKSRFEDPETQFALQQALPVAKHHARIGMQEMTDFEFLSEDGALQKTTFHDGTEVYANLGYQGARFVDGVGGIQSESWTAVYPDS